MPRPLHACVALLAAGLLAGCAGGTGAQAGATVGGDGRATLVRVVDGDTLLVRIDGAKAEQRVRMLGIDTPESVKPDTPVECFGKEASARTRALLPTGTILRLVGDVEDHDAYGRLLAYVYREPDDLFINLALVAEGYAQAYTYPPNVAHADELVRAGRDARQASLGLWSACPNARVGTDRTP